MEYKIDKQGHYYIDKIIAGQRCHLRGATKSELKKKYDAWILDQADRVSEKERGALFEDVAKAWWLDVTKRVKTGTVRSYKARYETALNEFSGNRIKDIKTYSISALLGRMMRKGYSRKTIANQKIVLSLIWQFWQQSPEWQGDSNPVTAAVIPKGAASTVRQPPTPEQLSAVKQHPEGFGITAWIIMYTGCRLAEANGLQVKDVDFNRPCFGITGSISINKAYPWKGNSPYYETTKTESGVRLVPIFAPLRPVLEKLCSELQPDDFLLSGTNKPLTKSMYDKRWAAYMKEIGHAHQHTYHYNKRGSKEGYDCTYWVPDVTAHQFRHELATACFEAGVPELVAQRILGHADISTTHKIYTHIRDRMLNSSAANLELFFTQSAPNKPI